MLGEVATSDRHIHCVRKVDGGREDCSCQARLRGSERYSDGIEWLDRFSRLAARSSEEYRPHSQQLSEDVMAMQKRFA